MISTDDIYRQTRDGLDIILAYYPQAEGCVEDRKKKFKIRQEEDDASANLYVNKNKVWCVTDFGDTGHYRTPIDVVMYEENCGFNEAVSIIASRFGIQGEELKKELNRPDFSKHPAGADEQEGERSWVVKPFTDAELKVLGPRVTKEHAESLHWFSLSSISYVKDRTVTVKHANENYPIFMRQCVKPDGSSFYKIYEPLNYDKQFRFSYYPEGGKPKSYINGLAELKADFNRFNETERSAWESDPLNEGKPYKEQKLSEAVICSGERDSLCCRAMGYHPLWFNSETYKVSPEEIKEIYRYVERIYNVPDIDATGIAKGKELALRFLDIYTVWLPSWLRTHRDRRGKPRKDLRDYVEIRPETQDFRNLMNVAMCARFWEKRWVEKSRSYKVDLNSSYLHYFLMLNGYYTLHDKDRDVAEFIHVGGAIVERVNSKDVKMFLKKFAAERYLDIEVRNAIIDNPRASGSALEQLDEIDLDFTSYTPDSQMLFFRNCSWKVTADGIEEFKGIATEGRYVWDDKVIDHQVKLQDCPFKATARVNSLGDLVTDVEILDTSSKFFCFLINSSRIYWRKELEYLWEDKPVEDSVAYRESHRFCIDSHLLTPDEVMEQKQNLVNKIFAIGYNLHRFKSQSRAWALYAMDNKIGDDDQVNGRSGKSFLFKAFSHFMRTDFLSGRNQRLMDNPHVFERVNQHTDFVLVDDCDKYLPVSQFYDSITSGMNVNPKNNRSFYLDFNHSPKFGFTTNYVPKEFDPSTNARLLYLVFSDYYHEQTVDNDYLETRSINADFGKDLMTPDSYTREEWNADINFFAHCLRFYLECCRTGVKVQPPIGNIILRKYKLDMGANFEDWAYTYFAEDGGNLNRLVQRDEAYDDFIQSSKTRKDLWTMRRFSVALRGFSEVCDYIVEMNPRSMLGKNGRLQRKNDQGQTKDYIYMMTEDMKDLQPNDSEEDNTPF